jgi:hypothetical protein
MPVAFTVNPFEGPETIGGDDDDSYGSFARSEEHLNRHFFGVWSNSVVRGTGFLQFGLTILHF